MGAQSGSIDFREYLPRKSPGAHDGHKSLGHENFVVTTEHYAGVGAVADAAASRVADALK
jgi:hypothetical protein